LCQIISLDEESSNYVFFILKVQKKKNMSLWRVFISGWILNFDVFLGYKLVYYSSYSDFYIFWVKYELKMSFYIKK